MRLFLIALVFLSGCVTSVCVDNLDISQDSFIPFPDRPELSSSQVSFDRTISYNAEPHVLKAFVVSDEEYFVEFYPTRAQSRLYGPFNGSFEEHVRCE